MTAPERRTLAHAIALGLAFAWACLTDAHGPMRVIAALVFAAWVWDARGRWTPQGNFGAANVVTAIRLALVFALDLLPPADVVPGAGIVLIVFFTLDGVDGLLARWTGSASAFGAAFDMETDAFMTAVATLAAVRADLVGPWVLLVGGLRYAFVIATHWTRRGPEPPRRWGRWAFSALMTGLIAGLIVPNPVTTSVLALGAAGVIASFGRSFVWAFTGR